MGFAQAGRKPALQQNWQSSEKSQNFKVKTHVSHQIRPLLTLPYTLPHSHGPMSRSQNLIISFTGVMDRILFQFQTSKMLCLKILCNFLYFIADNKNMTIVLVKNQNKMAYKFLKQNNHYI